MKKHLHLVQDLIAYNSFVASNEYITPNVTLVRSDGHCEFNPYTGSPSGSETGSSSGNGSGNNQHNYAMDYFTIIPQYTGSISIYSVSNISLEYSIDDASTWTTIYNEECSKLIDYIDVNNGDKVLFRGQIHPSAGDDSGSGSGDGSGSVTFSYPSLFSSYGDYNIEGNIMSLIYGDSFSTYSDIDLNDVDGNGTIITFKNMFDSDIHLINIENLSLPATTLAEYCYQYMFNGCRSLTNAPILSATTLANSCYSSMFYGCTSLITTPTLAATTLAECCYTCMFTNCTSLTTAPALPATTLANNCYSSMFYGCSSLTNAPILSATTLADYCYSSMFRDCTSLTTAPVLPATTLASDCYNNMFYGCTSLTTTPVLPATTLASYCYYQMFYGCTSLNYIKCLATDISATSCTNNWVYNVASSGTFVKDSNMTDWTTDINGIPSGWIVQDAL